MAAPCLQADRGEVFRLNQTQLDVAAKCRVGSEQPVVVWGTVQQRDAEYTDPSIHRSHGHNHA